jgi:putative effector of murein hydrolase LrgA (UPF0299 family)
MAFMFVPALMAALTPDCPIEELLMDLWILVAGGVVAVLVFYGFVALHLKRQYQRRRR